MASQIGNSMTSTSNLRAPILRDSAPPLSHELRLMQADDLPSMTSIFNAACRSRESTHGMRPWGIDEMSKFLIESPPVFESYVGVNDGAVVGWAALTRHHVRDGYKHTAEMSLYVEPSFRRKGMGTALAEKILSRASALNLHNILAVVFKDVPYVIASAEKRFSFSIAACFPEAFDDNGRYHDILILEKLVALEVT
jgi:L-amino acid N-acyltransferase YncA